MEVSSDYGCILYFLGPHFKNCGFGCTAVRSVLVEVVIPKNNFLPTFDPKKHAQRKKMARDPFFVIRKGVYFRRD